MPKEDSTHVMRRSCMLFTLGCQKYVDPTTNMLAGSYYYWWVNTFRLEIFSLWS